MENAREKMVIGATPDQCYAVAASFEEYPAWAQDIKEVVIVARDDKGRPAAVTFRAVASSSPASPLCRTGRAFNPFDAKLADLASNSGRPAYYSVWTIQRGT